MKILKFSIIAILLSIMASCNKYYYLPGDTVYRGYLKNTPDKWLNYEFYPLKDKYDEIHALSIKLKIE